MSPTTKRTVKNAMSRRFSRRELLFLTSGVVSLSTILLFLPYLRSMEQWSFHKAIGFEGASVSLPMRWIAGERGHLLSVRRPGMTLLFAHESTIVIDPFAERWPADKINKISDSWLKLHGTSADGRFRDTRTGGPITFAPAMKCVSFASPSAQNLIEIYCLSPDSVHSFEFFGEGDAISDFADVSAQASHIASKHPGTILRR